MIQDLSKEEKMRYSSIMYGGNYNSHREVEELDDQEKDKLKSIYAQKIAYDTVIIL